MTRIRRRSARQRRGLSPAERLFLLYGSVTAGHDGEVAYSTWDGEVWQLDRDAALDAWLLHRAELLEEAA
ncbi:hypothetical protein BH24CHL6_BH24CHL6_08750 [soil metagenome]